MGDILDVTYRLTQVFERLDISYLLVGSIASSMHGIPRATQDVDVVADLHPTHVFALVTALEDDFYVDAGAVRTALRRNSSFNVIHLASMFKVDVFISGDDTFSKREMQRRQTVLLSEEPRRELVVASPEDVLLHKLHWYRMSDEVSDRQWRDVLGIIKRCKGAGSTTRISSRWLLISKWKICSSRPGPRRSRSRVKTRRGGPLAGARSRNPRRRALLKAWSPERPACMDS